MPYYVVNRNAQTNGDHEVHETGCTFKPSSYQDLGYHESCHSAVRAAKLHYRQSNGCYFCSRACHTT